MVTRHWAETRQGHHYQETQTHTHAYSRHTQKAFTLSCPQHMLTDTHTHRQDTDRQKDTMAVCLCYCCLSGKFILARLSMKEQIGLLLAKTRESFKVR